MNTNAQQIAAFNRAIHAFFEYFEWCYGISIPPDHRAPVTQVIASRWSDPDQTVKDLMVYIISQHDVFSKRRPADRRQLRSQAQKILRDVFSWVETNGRGQALATLHQVIESLRPGCTGVPSKALQTPAPLPPPQASPYVSQVSPYPSPAPPYPSPYPPPTPWNPRAFDDASVPDIQQVLRQEKIRQQQLLMEQGIWDMRSATVDKILQKF